MKKMITALALSVLLWSCGGDKGTNNPPPQAPVTPHSPTPVNLAADQEVILTLTWQCSDPQSELLAYDVYFGANSNPPLVGSLQTTTSSLLKNSSFRCFL